MTRRPWGNGALLAGVGLVSAGIHLVALLAGLRFHRGDFSAAKLSTWWQLLPVSQLRHGLFGHVLALPSQPPLFNLVTGLLLQLPAVTRPPAADAVMFLCGVVVAVATAALLLELGVGRVATGVVVTLFVLADPAQYLYADVYFYALPTAALVTLGALAAVRWVRSERAAWGATYGACAALLVLTNSTYQAYLVALATIPVLVVLRRRWRQVLVVLCVPTIAVVAWYANDAVRFGTTTTSSWVGMNLARATLYLDSPTDVAALVHDHVLSPVASIRPFSPLSAYGALGRHAPTGEAPLDQRQKLNALEPNYNNLAYVAISNRYLSDDVKWIEHRPYDYLRNVTFGLRLWLLPTDQFYATDELGAYHLGGYTTVYDEVVQLQPDADLRAASSIVYSRQAPALDNLSYTSVAVTLLGVVALPIVALWRRRRDARRVAGALYVWATCALAFVTTTLLEAAENNRFRFELGGLPIVAATVAVAWALRAPPQASVGASTGGRVANETAEPGSRSPSMTSLQV